MVYHLAHVPFSDDMINHFYLDRTTKECHNLMAINLILYYFPLRFNWNLLISLVELNLVCTSYLFPNLVYHLSHVCFSDDMRNFQPIYTCTVVSLEDATYALDGY